MKQNQAAQKRKEGKKRTKKRKGKPSHFDTRKNKTMTARRRALLNSKSDKIDSDHNPDESFNYADDEEEDQDVDMEVDQDNNPDEADDSDE